MTAFTIPDISETTLLRAENARLKMLLAHALEEGDGWHDAGYGNGQMPDDYKPLLAEARRYAQGDAKELQEAITKAVLDAIQAERKRCHDIVQMAHEGSENYASDIASDIALGKVAP